MQDYDVVVKRLMTRPGSVLLEALTGTREVRWLNVETPKVRNPRRDLLGELPDRELVGIEIRARNVKDFGFRVGEYQYGTANRYGRMPRQVVLYIGRAPPRMPDRIEDRDDAVSELMILAGLRDLSDEVTE